MTRFSKPRLLTMDDWDVDFIFGLFGMVDNKTNDRWEVQMARVLDLGRGKEIWISGVGFLMADCGSCDGSDFLSEKEPGRNGPDSIVVGGIDSAQIQLGSVYPFEIGCWSMGKRTSRTDNKPKMKLFPLHEFPAIEAFWSEVWMFSFTLWPNSSQPIHDLSGRVAGKQGNHIQVSSWS
jgi:hypothetical protein